MFSKGDVHKCFGVNTKTQGCVHKWRLQVSTRRKNSVVLQFIFGVFGTIYDVISFFSVISSWWLVLTANWQAILDEAESIMNEINDGNIFDLQGSDKDELEEYEDLRTENEEGEANTENSDEMITSGKVTTKKVI